MALISTARHVGSPRSRKYDEPDWLRPTLTKSESCDRFISAWAVTAKSALAIADDDGSRPVDSNCKWGRERRILVRIISECMELRIDGDAVRRQPAARV